MHDVLQKFFAHPGPRNYLRVREQVLSRRRSRPQPQQLAELVDRFVAGDHAQVRAGIEVMMPAWALAPAVYWLGAAAARELGETDAAELDRFLYQCCLRGIMATGTGSADRPFCITYASDMDEVLYRKSLVREATELLRGKHGLCDVATCSGGEQIWFLLDGGIHDESPLHKIFQRASTILVR